MISKNHVAVITGASSGIGKAIALSLAKKNVHLVLASRRKKELEQVSKSCGKKAEAIVTDVTNPESVKKLFQHTIKKHGRIDILVYSAGVLYAGETDKMTIEDAKKTLDTNLLGAFYCSKYAFPFMKQSRSGHIVNISSIAGTKAQPMMALYSASKFALMGFSDSLHLEAKEYGVKVTTIRPGTVETDLWGKNWKNSSSTSVLLAKDVAEAVIYALDQPPHVCIRDISVQPHSAAP